MHQALLTALSNPADSSLMNETRSSLAGFPPGAFLIGAQKAGTTSLAALLGTHPHLLLSKPKEPDFYTGNWSKGLEWYRSRFPSQTNLVLLDASTSYAMAPICPEPESLMNQVPERIHSSRPDARFIYLLRDPVDRAISSYWHAVRAGNESRPLSECMTERTMYLRGSYYAFQLEHYRRHFPLDRFLVVRTKDFAARPQETVAQCWRFLGLDPALAPEPAIERRNESYVIKGPLAWILRIPGSKKFVKLAWKSIRGRLSPQSRATIKSRVSERPPGTPPDLRERLASEFSEEVRRLKDLTGVDLAS